MKNKMK